MSETIMVRSIPVKFVQASDGWHILSADGYNYLRKDGTFGFFDHPYDNWPTREAAEAFAREAGEKT